MQRLRLPMSSAEPPSLCVLWAAVSCALLLQVSYVLFRKWDFEEYEDVRPSDESYLYHECKCADSGLKGLGLGFGDYCSGSLRFLVHARLSTTLV